MRAVVSLLVLLAVPRDAPAQEEPKEPSLAELVREALEHNPEIQVAARTLEAKRARVGQAAALPLEQPIKVAPARLSVGETSQHDVLEAEVEMSRLEERRTELNARRAILEERLRSILYRRTGEPLGRPSPINPTTLPGSLEELLSRAEEQSPALREKARMVSQAERLADLAKRDRKPDFSVNFTYHNRGRLDPMY